MSSANAPKIVVTCAACGKSYSVKSELAGQSAKCGCGAQMKIPAATKPASSADRPRPQAPVPPKPKTGASVRSQATTKPATSKPIIPEFDVDEFDVEPPIARDEPPPVAPPVISDTQIPDRTTAGEMGNSAALRFVGVYGLGIMGFAILIGVLNVAGGIHLALRPNVSLAAGLVIFGIVAFQSLIYFILFRLGKGLVDSERSAVLGLTVLYVLGVAGAAYAMFSDYLIAGVVAASVLSVVMAPPIIVAYWNWGDFRAAEE